MKSVASKPNDLNTGIAKCQRRLLVGGNIAGKDQEAELRESEELSDDGAHT